MVVGFDTPLALQSGFDFSIFYSAALKVSKILSTSIHKDSSAKNALSMAQLSSFSEMPPCSAELYDLCETANGSAKESNSKYSKDDHEKNTHNIGLVVSTSRRLKWRGYQVITSGTKALKFTVENFIAGNSWLSATGLSFRTGL
ncbi:hypothetical protein CUMW_059080 [Citrus unshiu]|nr:hypothetical protein CUMW_059080 [Citrus unshiu]